MINLKGLVSTIALMSVSQVIFAANPKILSTYPELSQALTEGHSVRAIMTLNKCKADSTEVKKADVIGGANFTNFNIYQLEENGEKKNIIATSTHMLLEHGKFGTVYHYGRIRVYEDNTVKVFNEYLDPKAFTKHKAVSFTCHLSNGTDKNGVVLYDI
ncbi:MAG: VirK family protein [Candidatus Berkiellales bacterium]